MATKPEDTTNIELVRAGDIQQMLGIGYNQARELIKQFSKELKDLGYMVVPHRVPKDYVLKRFGLGVKFSDQ